MTITKKLTTTAVCLSVFAASPAFAAIPKAKIFPAALPHERITVIQDVAADDPYILAYKRIAQLLGSHLYLRMLESDKFLQLQELAINLLQRPNNLANYRH